MTPRNWIRAAVVALGLALILQGLWQILRADDADAAPCTAGATGAACLTPADIGPAPLPEQALRGTDGWRTADHG